jgi:hypothetical protein
MTTILRGADTRVCRVEIRLDAFWCWQNIAVSLKACLAGLFLLAASAQAQVANVSLSPSAGILPNGAIQPFTAIYSDYPWVSPSDGTTLLGGAADIAETDLDINTSPMAVAGLLHQVLELERRPLFGER